MPRVIHTAQALVDEVVQVASLLPRGGNAVGADLTRHAASAVNILTAAARQGADCVHAGSVGTGPNADLVRSALAHEGVLISSPAVSDLDTGQCFVLVEPSGERTFVTSWGAERHLTVASLQTSDPQPGDLVCVSGYTLQGPTCEPLLAWLDGLPGGVHVVLDPGAAMAEVAEDVRSAVLAATTVWSGNAHEAEQACGTSDMAEAPARIATLLPPGAVVIVRDGDRGCAVRVDGETTEVAGFPQRAVDTNGAGDAHTGILVAGRAAGLDWVEACRRANAGAAIKVTRRGPATAPTAEEIDAFLTGQAPARPSTG